MIARFTALSSSFARNPATLKAALLGASALASAVALAEAGRAQSVTLTGDDDTYVVDDSGRYSTSVDAADGYDLLQVNRNSPLRLDLDGFINFEAALKDGSGALTLAGDGSTLIWGLRNGGILLDSGATILGVHNLVSTPLKAVTVSNAGTIGAGSVSLLADISSVINSGSIGGGVFLSGAGNTAVNSGSITGLIHLAGSRAAFTNTGTVQGDGRTTTSVRLNGAGFALTNSGDIFGGETGLLATGNSGRIENSGLIIAESLTDSEAGLEVEGDGFTLLNGGVIRAGAPNDGSGATPPASRFVNAVEIDGDRARVENTGVIQAVGEYANGVETAGADNRIVNTGEIAAHGPDAIGLNLLGVSVSSGGVTTIAPVAGSVVNSGTINGEGARAIGARLGTLAGQSASLRNLAGGVIRGAAIGVQGGDGDDLVENHGAVLGGEYAFQLQDGDDTLTLFAGSRHSGLIDGGDGFDTLVVDGAAGVFALNMDEVSGFEAATKSGASELTLSGSSAETWVLEGGTLRVLEAASVGTVFSRSRENVTLINEGEAVSLALTRGSITNSGVAGAQQPSFAPAPALAAFGDAVRVNNSGTAVSLGDRGFAVHLAGDALTLSNSGGIFASSTRYDAAVGLFGDRGQIINSGEISARNGAVLVRGDGTLLGNTGDIVLLADGRYQSAVEVEGENNHVYNAGLISAGLNEDGIIADVLGAGAVELDGASNSLSNAGTIVAGGEAATGVAVSGSGHSVSNGETGRILAIGSGAAAVRLSAVTGSNATARSIGSVTNGGVIAATGTDSTGVVVFSVEGQSNTITNLAGGIISGARYGVRSEDGDETIANYGSITGGEYAVSLGRGSDTLMMFDGSSYSGLLDGGDGLDSLLIENQDGLAFGMGDLVDFEILEKRGEGELSLSGDGSDQTWRVSRGSVRIEAGAVGGFFYTTPQSAEVTVRNDGTVAGGLGLGSGGEVINAGLFDVNRYAGVAIGAAADGVRVENLGVVQATAARGKGVSLSGDDTVVENQGSILTTGDTYAISIELDGDRASLFNSGEIGANNAAVTLRGDFGLISNSGAVRLFSAGSYQSAVEIDGASNELFNTGEIIAGVGADGVIEGVSSTRAIEINGDRNRVVNTGRVIAAGASASGVRIAGGDNDFSNGEQGLVHVSGADATGIALSAVTTFGPDAETVARTIGRVSNFGRIIAAGEDAVGIAVYSADGQSHIVTNYEGAAIVAQGTGVLGGDGADTVVNYGVIIGEDFALDLGAGDDELVFGAGAIMQGVARGGDGFDRLTLVEGESRSEGVFDLGLLDSFEAVNTMSGFWRLVGSGQLGSLTVLQGSTLGGTAQLTGDLLIDGTLAPGNSIGALTVVGDVTLTGASAMVAEVHGSGAADTLIVDGALALEGGALVIDPLAGRYSVRTTYELLSATGGIDGAFGDIDVLGAFNPFVTVSANSVALTLMRDIDFTADARSRNANAVGASLNAALRPDADQDLIDVMDGLVSLSGADRGAALVDLSSDVYATSALLDLGAHALLQSGGRGGDAGPWLETLGGTARIGSQMGARGLSEDLYGALAGYGWVGETAEAEISFAYLDREADGRGVQLETRSTGLSARIARSFGPYQAEARGAVMHHDTQSVRALALGSASRLAMGEVDSRTWGGELSLARRFDTVGFGGAVLVPSASLAATRHDGGDIEESGAGSVALDGRVDTLDSVVSRLGVTAEWGGGEDVGALFRAAWAHEHADTRGTVLGGFDTAAPAFAADGVQVARDALELGVSVDTQIARNVRISAEYDASLSNDVSRELARFGLSVRF